MGLDAALGPGPVGLDTAPFIYFIENHPVYYAAVRPLFEGADAGRWLAVTSGLTLLETLVVPYRAKDLVLAARYENILTRGRGLQMLPLSGALLRAAARLRAEHRIKTPDAIQVATALSRKCSVFVTHDRRLPAIPGIRIVQVSDLAGSD